MTYELVVVCFKNHTESHYVDCQILESLSNYIIGREHDNKLEFIPKERVSCVLPFRYKTSYGGVYVQN